MLSLCALKEDSEGEVQTKDAAGAVEHMDADELEGDVLELKRMFQKFMADQLERDECQAQEAACQETRWKSLQHQF